MQVAQGSHEQVFLGRQLALFGFRLLEDRPSIIDQARDQRRFVGRLSAPSVVPLAGIWLRPHFVLASTVACFFGFLVRHTSGFSTLGIPPDGSIFPAPNVPARNFCRKFAFAVDQKSYPVIFRIPLEAGLLSRETEEAGSRNFWDCKLNSILSRHDERQRELSPAPGLSFLSPASCAAPLVL